MSAQNQPQTTKQTNERDAAIQIPTTETHPDLNDIFESTGEIEAGWWTANVELFLDPDEAEDPDVVRLSYSVFSGETMYPHRIQVRVVAGSTMDDVCFRSLSEAAKFASKSRQKLTELGFQSIGPLAR